jgi:hypothetical protein
VSTSVENDFGAAMTEWAARTPAVKGLVLIGSRERQASDAVWRADAQSDWDFQIITTDPTRFAKDDWTRELGGVDLRVYAAQTARVGSVPRVNAIFAQAVVDIKVIPAGRLRMAKLLVALGLHRHEGWLRHGLRDLAIVIRPGWRFFKGGATWNPFYRRIVAEVDDARLGFTEVARLASIFFCEANSVRVKIARGELVAAQLILHRDLADISFRLLHEARLRRGERSFPDARRVEWVATPSELAAISVSARLDAGEMTVALARSETTLRELMTALTGGRWTWPL